MYLTYLSVTYFVDIRSRVDPYIDVQVLQHRPSGAPHKENSDQHNNHRRTNNHFSVSVRIREHISTSIRDGPPETREEDHVLSVHGDQHCATVLLHRSLLAVLVDIVQQRVNMKASGDNAKEQTPKDKVRAVTRGGRL